MGWRFWLGLGPVLLIVGLLAVANRAPALLSLSPLPFDLEAPLILLLLGAAFLGYLAGALSLYLAQAARRRREKALAREAQALRREVAQLRTHLPASAALPAPE